MYDNGLVEHAYAPLECRSNVVVAVFKLELQYVVYRATDHVEVSEAGQLARPAAGADEPPLLVKDEEGGVRGGIVVVEELEQEPETAFFAGAGAILESRRPLGGDAAVPAVRADEDRHVDASG
jgi:hypothetical protein